MPLLPIFRYGFQVFIARKDRGSGLVPPSGQTRKSVGAIADHRQVIGYRLRLHAELGLDAGLVADDVGPAIELNDTCAFNTLAEILIRRANDDLLYAIILRGFSGGGGQGVVRFIVDHRPDYYAHVVERFFENREL